MHPYAVGNVGVTGIEFSFAEIAQVAFVSCCAIGVAGEGGGDWTGARVTIR